MAADEIARLWDVYVRAPFPPALRGAEIAGIDMVLLDAHTAGCVSSWLSSGGRLDAWRRTAIASCLAELNTVLPLLTDPTQAAYYRRLRDLARRICTESTAASECP
ncbi:hypothetical protein [Amycolatopsis sp. RTGN1]|uniref:hypothetical protein n=1 Tax=Amycolatopsis ponsaeliensis TaxID=2992142 RepID=UPI00254A9132|nr:hypothetical protein [Amycolatopsis sp. RTGN1]